MTVLFLKAHVPGHQRKLEDGQVVYVRPYDTRRPAAHDVRQADLFAAPAPAPAPTKPPPSPPALVVPFPKRAEAAPSPAAAGGPDLPSYDRVVVAFSGGKDSVAAVLALLDAGVPKEKVELWHHDIDGGAGHLMDWPVTPAYCRAFAAALGLPIYFSYREGGFEREMTRQDSATAAVVFDKPDGTKGRAGGVSNHLGTRMKFPQVSADLKTRWCSGALKVDVMAAAMRNQDRFKGSRTLVVTGERAQESSNRARYKTFEPHRTHTGERHVDHWRPVHGLQEADVWEMMRQHGVVPHPAYQLGYGRLSCRHCIFADPDQLATNRTLYPESFDRIAGYERQFNTTIHRKETVHQRAEKGRAYEAALAQPDLAHMADSPDWRGPIIVPPSEWKMPAGAFGHSSGPT